MFILVSNHIPTGYGFSLNKKKIFFWKKDKRKLSLAENFVFVLETVQWLNTE